jgi:polyisoprenoid-binding protein YceI
LILVVVFWAATSLASASSAWAQHPLGPASLRSGTLSFDGKATLGDFTGVTTTVSGEMVGGPGLADVRGWVEAPVTTLKTGNGRRDKDLNKSMESEQFPTIRFDLDSVRPQWERGDSAAVELVGRFTIHGVTQERTFRAAVLFEGDGVRVKASLPLNLKDYRIGGLSKFLGTIKMHPDILVHIDVLFGGPETPAGAPSQPARDSAR